jgi:hypothetical protein
MNEVRATQMATAIATQHGLTREAAFDLVLATARGLEIAGTRFSEKAAAEIEAAIARDIKSGTPAILNRPTIGA